MTGKAASAAFRLDPTADGIFATLTSCSGCSGTAAGTLELFRLDLWYLSSFSLCYDSSTTTGLSSIFQFPWEELSHKASSSDLIRTVVSLATSLSCVYPTNGSILYLFTLARHAEAFLHTWLNRLKASTCNGVTLSSLLSEAEDCSRLFP